MRLVLFLAWLKYGRVCPRCDEYTGYRFGRTCDTCQSVEKIIAAFREYVKLKETK